MSVVDLQLIVYKIRTVVFRQRVQVSWPQKMSVSHGMIATAAQNQEPTKGLARVQYLLNSFPDNEQPFDSRCFESTTKAAVAGSCGV